MSVSSRTIALWTAPRSISSAFERTFSQRQDTQTFFEPFFNVYHFSRWRQATRLGELEKARDYSPQDAMALVHSARTPIAFFKEMAFVYLPYADPTFLGSLTNTFLIRRPEFSLKGWLKLGTSPTEEMLGFKKLQELFHQVIQDLGQPPIVVEASAFQNDPAGILAAYCQQIDIEFLPEMLSWEAAEHPTWEKDLMTDEDWQKWHHTLNASTSILPAPSTLPEIPETYQEVLDSALEVYHEISAHALHAKLI